MYERRISFLLGPPTTKGWIQSINQSSISRPRTTFTPFLSLWMLGLREGLSGPTDANGNRQGSITLILILDLNSLELFHNSRYVSLMELKMCERTS